METIIQRAREKLPRRHATHHHRQRAPVHRQGLQGVHPHRRHDPRQNLALLPPKQRQDRTLAQNPQRRLHPRQGPAVPRRRPPHRRRVTSPITTPSACTVPSATSRPRTNSTATTKPSSPSATANWPRPANAASKCARHGTSKPKPSPIRHAPPSTSPPCAPPSPSPRSSHLLGFTPAIRPRRPATRRRVPCTAPPQAPAAASPPTLDAPDLPLLQVRPLRQRPRPLGRRQPPVDLRCRRRSVPTPQHPAAPTNTRSRPATEKRKP